MRIETIVTPGIAHRAYLIECSGEAAIVDPARDSARYLKRLRERALNLRYIIETHRQEDFEHGSTNLQAATGAAVVNGIHDYFGRGDIRMRDEERIGLGNTMIMALETPGHTPESMSYAIFANKDDSKAAGVFTGDTLLFGDTGRTDLPGKPQQRDNAALIYDSVHQRLAPLGDQAQVFPAHGAGSVCGHGVANRSSSTLGTEKNYNKVFALSRARFVEEKGNESLSRPPYFRHLEQVNLLGGRPIPKQPEAERWLDPGALQALAKQDGTVLIDARGPEAFAGAHIPASFAIWRGGLPLFGGWVATPEDDIALILERNGDRHDIVSHFARIGFDNVVGALRNGFDAWRNDGREFSSHAVMAPSELAERRRDYQIIDVRERDEFANGHIEGAINMFVGTLAAQLPQADLDASRPTVVTCGVGHRAALAASILLQHRFTNVRNLLGGMKAWHASDLAVETEAERK